MSTDRLSSYNPMPSTLTHLHLVCDVRVLSLPEADANPIVLHDALPPSLLCLCLFMHSTAISETLLSSLPNQCPQLRHCSITNIGRGASVKWERAFQFR